MFSYDFGKLWRYTTWWIVGAFWVPMSETGQMGTHGASTKWNKKASELFCIFVLQLNHVHIYCQYSLSSCPVCYGKQSFLSIPLTIPLLRPVGVGVVNVTVLFHLNLVLLTVRKNTAHTKKIRLNIHLFLSLVTSLLANIYIMLCNFSTQSYSYLIH